MTKKEPIRITKDFAKQLVYDSIYDGFNSMDKRFRLIDSLSLSLMSINVDGRLNLQIVRDMKCGEVNVNLLDHLRTYYHEAYKILENENNVITHWCKFHHEFDMVYLKDEHDPASSRYKYSKYITLRQALHYKSDGNRYKFNHRIYKGLTVFLCFESLSDDKMLLDYILVIAHA